MYQFSAELKRETIALSENESFHLNCLIPITCELWIGGPAHVPVFSRVGGDEMNQMKVKVLSYFWISLLTFLRMSVLATVWRTKVLVL